MFDKTIEILTILVSNANELETYGFYRYILAKKPIRFTLSQTKGEQLVIQVIGPDPDEIRSVSTLIRKFCSDEPTSLKNLNLLIDDPGLSEQWKKGYVDIREKVNSFLDSRNSLLIGKSCEEKSEPMPTRREIFDIFINGKIFHDKDKNKRNLYNDWKSDDIFFGLIATEMNSILLNLCSAISALSGISKKELGL